MNTNENETILESNNGITDVDTIDNVTIDYAVNTYDDVADIAKINNEIETRTRKANNIIRTTSNGITWRVMRLLPEHVADIENKMYLNGWRIDGNKPELSQVYTGKRTHEYKGKKYTRNIFALAIAKNGKPFLLTSGLNVPRNNRQDVINLEKSINKIRQVKKLAQANGTYSDTLFHNRTDSAKVEDTETDVNLYDETVSDLA